jgi:trimeric autotransporter adhesin
MKKNTSLFRAAGLGFAFTAGSLAIAAALSSQAHAQAGCAFTGGGGSFVPGGNHSFNCGPGAGVGSGASTNTDNTALGDAAGVNVSGSGNTASGHDAGIRVTGFNNTANGLSAGSTVTGSGNTANGSAAGSIVTGDTNVALGSGAGRLLGTAGRLASDNIAIGDGAGSGSPASPLLVNNTIAVGNNAQATADNAIAIGLNASSTGQNAIVIGNNVTTTRANQVSVGNAGNQYTFAGITSGASAALQTGPLQVVTSDAGGNLATDGGAIFGSLNQLRQEDKRLTAGIAMAAAIPHAYVGPGKTMAFDIDWANYAGANGIGIDGAIRLGQIDYAGGSIGVQGHAGAGFAADGNSGGRAIGKAGMHFEW